MDTQNLILVLLIGLLFYSAANADIQPSSGETPLNQAFRLNGVSQCQPKIQQVADFVSQGTSSTVILMLPPEHRDSHLVSASMELVENNHSFYASLWFSPSSRSTCDASLETLTYWSNTCSSISKHQFKEATPLGKMQQNITVLTYGKYLHIFLIPAGQGCISIKKQLVSDAL